MLHSVAESLHVVVQPPFGHSVLQAAPAVHVASQPPPSQATLQLAV